MDSLSVFLTFLAIILLRAPLLMGVFWENSFSRSLRGRHYDLSPWLLENIDAAGQLAMEHCQKQFQWDRWNCPTREFINWNSKPAQRTNREHAFMDALISAAFVHTIARNCSLGFSCPGLRHRRYAEKMMWAKHRSDQIDYGEYIVQSYLENSPPVTDPISFAIRHNIILGRKAVRNTAAQKCMCHGVSGTCTLKTCWAKTASFQTVAAQIRKRYEKAIRLDFEGTRGMKIGNSVTSLFKAPAGINSNELLYVENSPDYCKPNVSIAWQGTKGRTCTKKGQNGGGKGSCRNLCRKCGYTVRRKKKNTKWCNCKFTWCCQVTCDLCDKTETEYYCA